MDRWDRAFLYGGMTDEEIACALEQMRTRKPMPSGLNRHERRAWQARERKEVRP